MVIKEKFVARISLLFIYTLSFLPFFVYGQFDKKRVEAVMNEYMTLMQDYSNLPLSSDAVEKKAELINLFDLNAIAGYEYASDLFRPEECNGISLNSYLDFIAKKYHNKIDVSFSNIYFYNCNIKNSGKEFAIVSVDKSLKYTGDKPIIGDKIKRVSLIIGIDISNYKIHMVVFKSNFINPNKDCLDQKQEAELKLAEKRFYLSKELFIKLASQDSEYEDYALKKIIECDNGLGIENYELYKKFGDEYYNKQSYQNALKSFQMALRYKINDSYILDMIRKCEIKKQK